MAEKFELGDVVLCVNTHGLIEYGWQIPKLMEHYTVERVFENGDVRLTEVNNDAHDSLSSQFTGRGHSDFYPWRFVKVGESEEFWIQKIQNSAIEINHPMKDRVIRIVEIEGTHIRFHMQGMKHGVFTATKEFLSQY